MPRQKKAFIDKKKATKFRLIPGFLPNEENRDLLVTDEEKEKRKEEQRKFGIFYDDDYDYMQHLRTLEGATMVKVSDLNDIEEETRSSYGGSVNFRMPWPTSENEKKEEHIDSDILASLDEAPEVKINEDGEMEINDEVDFLEDDFISKAGGFQPKADTDYELNSIMEDQELGSDFDEYSDNEFYDDFYDEDSEDADDGDGTQPSIGRGNTQDDVVEAQTALILKNFEEGLGFSCMAQHFDDEEGRATVEDMENLKEMILQDKLKKENMMTAAEFLDDHASRPPIDTVKYSYEQEEEFEWKEVPPSKPKFDCVSILSLNSNTRNLPTDILPPSQKKRSKNSTSETDDPSIAERGLSRRELEEEIRLSRKADKASTFRPQDETADERKNRKKAIKEERKERRQEKKANKLVFSMEKQQMDKEVVALSKSSKGLKLT